MTAPREPFSGILTALVTPFCPDLSVDFKALNRLLARQKAAGIHGVVVLGTTGESPTLNEEESDAIVRTALNYQDDHFAVYVGTGTFDTAKTVAKSQKYAAFTGDNHQKPGGVMVVTPYYNKPMQSHLVAHYEAVCQAIPTTPVCVYNVPGRTGVNLTSETCVEIVHKNPNVVAFKEASGNLSAIGHLRWLLSHSGAAHIRILSGDDPLFAPGLIAGADGLISVSAHVVPHKILALWQAYQTADLVQLRQIHLSLEALHHLLFQVPNPTGIKACLSLLGWCQPYLRPPLYALTQEDLNFKELEHLLWEHL